MFTLRGKILKAIIIPLKIELIAAFVINLLLINPVIFAASFDSPDNSPSRHLDRYERPRTPGFMKQDTTSSHLPPLPQLPGFEEGGSLSSLGNIEVSTFKFVGNKAISTEELRKLVADYENRTITAEELQMAKNKITEHYINKGYVNSGAIIPDQKVDDGHVEFHIIEGALHKVEVYNRNEADEEGHLAKDYIRSRVELGDDEALNIEHLQQKLQLLHQSPLFERINAELGPGINLGEGILKLEVTEAPRNVLGFSFNNHRSPSVGAYRGEIFWRNHNVTGWGDSLYGRVGLTNGLQDYTLDYKIPLNRYDTLLGFHVEASDAEVVSQPFDQLNIESEANTYAINIEHPFYRTPNEEFKLGLKFEKRNSTTYIFRGTPLEQQFSFSPGVQNGESHISVIRFSQNWLARSRTQVLAARSSFNFGVDALDATINEDGAPDSQFFSWLGQFQWVQRINAFGKEDTQLLFRTDLQWARESLLPLEKFSVGGASTVRGYRENLLTRDSGLISSLEWRIPIMALPLPGITKESEKGLLQLAPFVDYGRSWNVDLETPTPKDIASAGLGLRWMPSETINAIVYWGKAFRTVETPQDSDLQDDGVHFEVNIHIPF